MDHVATVIKLRKNLKKFDKSKNFLSLNIEKVKAEIMEHKKNILIGCTGSVAAIKLPVVLNLLKKRDQTFQVSWYHGSLNFQCSPLTSRSSSLEFVDKSRID